MKNPCIDPAFITITSVPLQNTAYVLFEYPGTGFTFSHDPFVITTQPFQHDMCGGLTYLATFMGNTITAATQPMNYDTATREFNIYAEPFSLIGLQTFTVKAHLTAYPQTTTASPDQQAIIDIIDPCIDPDGIVSALQTNPAEYLYSAVPAKFRINKF